MNETCRTCKFWQDYSDRVFANISNARSSMARNTIELRRCQYTPPPQMLDAARRYTDEDYSCSGWSPAEPIGKEAK